MAEIQVERGAVADQAGEATLAAVRVSESLGGTVVVWARASAAAAARSNASRLYFIDIPLCAWGSMCSFFSTTQLLPFAGESPYAAFQGFVRLSRPGSARSDLRVTFLPSPHGRTSCLEFHHVRLAGRA